VVGKLKIDELNDILDKLSSPVWSDRTKALKKLCEIKSQDDVLTLFKRVWREKDVNHIFAMLQLIEVLLNEPKVESIGIGLFCLNYFRDFENIKIKAESIKLNDNFFESPVTYRYLKVASLKKCWELSSVAKRYHLTKIIGEHHFFELVPAVLSNFEHQNRPLILLSIEVIKKLEDPRGIRFFKKISKETEDEEILLACIIGLERIGSFFDGFFYRQYLNHSSRKIVLASISGMASLLQKYSIPYFKKLYLEANTVELKSEVIQKIGTVQHKKAGEFLISLYEVETDGDVLVKLEWALQALDKKFVVEPLIKLFINSTDQVRFRVLTFFGEIYHEDCYKLLRKVIQGGYNEFITISALDSIAVYDNEEAANHIEKLALNTESQVCYYALISLYHHDSYDHEGLVTKFINLKADLSHSGHQIILNIIRSKKLSFSRKKTIEKYLEGVLTSKASNNTFLAIECSAKVFNEEIFKRLFFISHQTKNKFIEKSCIESLIKILGKEPLMMKVNPEVLVDERILARFNPSKMKKEFLFSLLSVIDDVGWKHYVPFTSKFGSYVSENVKTYLRSWESVEELSQMLKFLNRIGYKGSLETIEYLVDEVYHLCDPDNQFLILNLVSNYNNPDYLDFILNESLKDKKFGEVGYELVQHYIDGLV
jgi:hypothetical protein